MPVASENIPRVKDDPVLSLEYLEPPSSRSPITTTTPSRTRDGRSRGTRLPARPKNLNFRIALTEAIDKQAFINATFAGIGQVANSFVMPGIPGYEPNLDPYPYNLASRQGPPGHGPGALRRHCGRAQQAEVRLQHRRRPRAAGRLPGRGLATGVRPADRADRVGLQRLPRRSEPRAYTTSPATAGAPTIRTPTISSVACSPAVAATTRPVVVQPGVRCADRQGASRAGPGRAGRTLQGGPDDPDGRRAVAPAALRPDDVRRLPRMSRA